MKDSVIKFGHVSMELNFWLHTLALILTSFCPWRDFICRKGFNDDGLIKFFLLNESYSEITNGILKSVKSRIGFPNVFFEKK